MEDVELNDVAKGVCVCVRKGNSRTTGNSNSGERMKCSHLLKTEMNHFELGESRSKDKQNRDSEVSMGIDNQEGVKIFARKVLFTCTYLSSFKNGKVI